MLTKTRDQQAAAAQEPVRRPMTMIQALRSAMDVMLERDDNVVVFGQDVGYFGGVFRCTEGLQAKYGTSRCFDAPISEGGIVGTAIGMGAYGLRPVVEIQFADYFYPASDQIVSEAARLRYRSAGDFTAPLTIRMPCGGGIYGGQTHSQSPEALFTHVCGLRTVMPSNPYDAKGLLIASIENDDPVIFLEPKRLYNGPFDGHHDRPVVPWSQHALGEVPEGYYTVPLESAAVFRPGKDVTVLTYGTMVYVSECGGARDRHRRRDHRPAHASGRWTCRPSSTRSRRPAAASSCTKRRGPAASAPSWWRWCRSTASTTWRRRSNALPAGTRHIRMRRNGPTSPARRASAPPSSAPWRPEHVDLHHQDARHRRRHCRRWNWWRGTSSPATRWPRTRCWPT